MSEDRWNDEDEQAQFAREQQIWIAKEARRKQSQSSLLWGFGAVLALILLAASSCSGRAAALAADRPEKPGAWFCIKARAAVLATGSEKAAEDAARAQGASEVTIAKAKRCPR